jgi:uncharacterized Zn finger protein
LIKAECSGKIDSLVELLQGRLSNAVLRIITDREKGLFPTPSEIKKSCSCPDWADLCKHLAAVLYGMGSRLDQEPELLFLLRGADHLELIGSAAESGLLAPADSGSLADSDLAEVFGIDIAEGVPARQPQATKTSARVARPRRKESRRKSSARRAARQRRARPATRK